MSKSDTDLISAVNIALELYQAIDHVRVATAGGHMEHALTPLHPSCNHPGLQTFTAYAACYFW